MSGNHGESWGGEESLFLGEIIGDFVQILHFAKEGCNHNHGNLGSRPLAAKILLWWNLALVNHSYRTEPLS